MAGRAEFLYEHIKDRIAIEGLIGEPEDGHLDCKEWPRKDKDAHDMLAKAVCGLTNSDGGVLIIGMRAKPQNAGDPDVITSIEPVPDTSQVRSRVLNLVGNLVEPGIVGIETREIGEEIGAKSGVVIVFVPKTEGPPCRSRKDSRFYIRVGSSTLPMEYWQIEDRFGSRPHPKLEMCLEERQIAAPVPGVGDPVRHLVLGIKNIGGGIAKFPGLQFKRSAGLSIDPYRIDGNLNFGLPRRPSESEWIIFGGGVDNVIYPGQTLMIAKLSQSGEDVGMQGIPITEQPMRQNRVIKKRLVYRALRFACAISCEGCQTINVEQEIRESSTIVDF